MNKKEFNALLKTRTAYDIIRMHYNSMITLTSLQLDKILQIPNEERKRVKNDNKKDN